MPTSVPTHDPLTRPSEDPHSLAGLLFNIVIPVIVLHQLSKRLPVHGPQIALAVALLFPLGYGLWDWRKRHKLNAFSVVGLINVLVTGTLAISALHGRWFVLKEVALPLILGGAILFSAFTRKPFVQTLFLNPKILQLDKLYDQLQANGKMEEFGGYLRRATLLLSASFACSAVINFFLASRIFTDIDTSLSAHDQALILNQQIAQMTGLASVVILVPSLIFTSAILYYLLYGIRVLTGFNADDVLQS